jgi:hypothetical protein
MVNSFTRNHADNSTEAGFQFTFYCDVCNDGHKSEFVESTTYGKGKLLRGIGQGASVLGSFLGGRASSLGWSADRATDIIGEKFEQRSPEWQKEHEDAFAAAQNQALPYFYRCPSCNQYACRQCHNEDTGLCVRCSPRQEVAVAKAHADAMLRNITEAGEAATVWQGTIEAKTTMCPACGKPAGTGKFCNNCGHSMALKTCPSCGTENSQEVRFCNNCGTNLQVPQAVACPNCGVSNPPGTKFCGSCGTPQS